MSDNPTQTPVVMPSMQVPGISDKDIQMMAVAIGGFAQPLAEAQKTVAMETTKQAQIAANVTTTVYRGFFIVGVLVIALAAAAMFTGKDQTAEKLVFALLGFLGGLGFAKWVQK
jgi:hypothetical protein